MVMLTGVQSNQFPRALDIARPLRARGIQVGIGGFHVSGVISMFGGDDAATAPRRRPWASRCSPARRKAGSTRCCATPCGALKPLYNFMNDLPGSKARRSRCCRRERAQRTAGA